MSNLKPKLNEVLKRVENTARNGELPIAIFDLDSTLFSIAARNLRILWEFASAFQREHPDLAAAAARVSLVDLGWSYTQPLIEQGIAEDHPALEDLKAHWRARFFSDEYVVLDLPNPGAPEFVNACHRAGALAYYLTGRHVSSAAIDVAKPGRDRCTPKTTPGMEFGTARALTQHGFPFWQDRCELHLKPACEMEDATFKEDVLKKISSLHGAVVATFDNEPGNCNQFIERFPKAMNFLVGRVHSPEAEKPAEGLIWIDDFT